MRPTSKPAAPTVTERLARLAYGVLWALILAAAAVLVRDAVTGNLPFQTRVDPRTGTAAFFVETDAGTGCQYVLTPWGGIMPRTGPDGKQVCAKTP